MYSGKAHYFGILLLLCSCLEDSACVSSNTQVVEVGFYSMASRTPVDVEIDSIFIKSPYTLLAKDINSGMVDILLAPEQPSVFIVFRGTNLNDSVKIDYQVLPKLYAPQCEVELIFDELNPSISTFDSLGNLLNRTPSRLEVYF